MFGQGGDFHKATNAATAERRMGQSDLEHETPLRHIGAHPLSYHRFEIGPRHGIPSRQQS